MENFDIIAKLTEYEVAKESIVRSNSDAPDFNGLLERALSIRSEIISAFTELSKPQTEASYHVAYQIQECNFPMISGDTLVVGFSGIRSKKDLDELKDIMLPHLCEELGIDPQSSKVTIRNIQKLPI